MGKKQFIKKNNAVTFKLVHRSQQDERMADNDASPYVLLPVAGAPEKVDAILKNAYTQKETEGEDVEGDDVIEDEVNRRKEEQARHGIYYDDEYNYMAHLKNVGEDPSGVLIAAPKQKGVVVPDMNAPIVDLPADVFPSQNQNEVGMLNLAAPRTGPQLDVDFEMLAQLDDDAEHNEDWAMDDDFVIVGEGEGGYSEEENEQYKYDGGAFDSRWHFVKQKNTNRSDDNQSFGSSGRAHGSFAGSDHEDFDEDVETGSQASRFTEYSMSSSVMHRNDKLQLLDDRFESVYAQYDEEDIGELDEETTEGLRELDDFNQILDQFLSTKAIGKNAPGDDSLHRPDAEVTKTEVVQRVIASAVEEVLTEEEMSRQRVHNEAKDEWLRERLQDELEEKRKRENDAWDCDTIVSTYSNIYNHPALIKETNSKSRRNKNAEGSADKSGSVEAKNEQAGGNDDDSGSENGDDEYVEPSNKGKARNKKETTEEKKLRKAQIKQERQTRRINKKTTKEVYKQEELRQEKIQKGKLNIVNMS
eukprot:CFRG8095T1